MNRSIIRYILGNVLKIEAVFLLFPCLVSVIYKESEGVSYLLVAIISALVGFALTAYKPTSDVFYLKEGCITTAASWIVMSLVGTLPFVFTKEIPSFTDALFETISGFTTTGASILNDVEALSYCSLFWRSFTHWIGGMGVLVFLLAVVPMSGGSNINLMKAESPGPSVGKLVPKMRHSARILYLIYLVMTIAEMIFLLAGGMPIFDAVTLSIGTAGTGGFGILNDSIASYTPYMQWVITIFMILFAINFNAYYFILLKEFKKAFSLSEVRTFLGIVLVASGIITVELVRGSMNIVDALRHAFFQVASVISTTGFATIDYDLWSGASKTVLILVMFIGGCAGSTAGGTKVSRLVILVKTVAKEITNYIHPRSIKKIKMDDKSIEHEVVRATNVYFITFFMLFALSVFIVSFEEKDLVTNFTAVLATINNIGPGLSMAGPTENYAHFTPLTKYVLMFDMLAGRLELFPLLLIFVPSIWKDFFFRNEKHLKNKSKK